MTFDSSSFLQPTRGALLLFTSLPLSAAATAVVVLVYSCLFNDNCCQFQLSLTLQMWILACLATTAHPESICTDSSLFVTCLIDTRLSNPDTVLQLLLEHDPQIIVGMVFGLVACV
jgi:hypothetical protein